MIDHRRDAYLLDSFRSWKPVQFLYRIYFQNYRLSSPSILSFSSIARSVRFGFFTDETVKQPDTRNIFVSRDFQRFSIPIVSARDHVTRIKRKSVNSRDCQWEIHVADDRATEYGTESSTESEQGLRVFDWLMNFSTVAICLIRLRARWELHFSLDVESNGATRSARFVSGACVCSRTMEIREYLRKKNDVNALARNCNLAPDSRSIPSLERIFVRIIIHFVLHVRIQYIRAVCRHLCSSASFPSEFPFSNFDAFRNRKRS